jgi:two-component system cell cycle sensor histidine kinase/response regulator CckA
MPYEYQEEKLRRLTDAAFDGIVVHDRERLIEVNASCARMYGYEVEEMVGQPLQKFFPPGEMEQASALVQSGVSRYESLALRKDGSILEVEISSAVLGEGAMHIVAIRDISARKVLESTRQEAAGRLAESELRYRELSESTHDLICEHDLEGRILEVNSAAARALGYSREQLEGMNLRDLFGEEGAGAFQGYVAAIVRDGVAEGQMVLRTAGGEVRLWHYQNTLRTTGLEAPRVRGLARDVTERELAVRNLRRSEQHFRSIIENVSDMIAIFTPAGIVDYYSPSVVRILGYSGEELSGHHFSAFIHPEDQPRAAAFFAAQLEGAEPGAEIELRLRHRRGTWRWVSIVGTTRLHHGRVASVIFNGRDVTDRRLLKAQLEQANRVNSLGRLAATVAHEFNNVLMGMQPFSELLQRPDVAPPMVAKAARYIAGSIARGKRVALDILRFTRPAQPTLQPVDLGVWWNHLLPELQGAIGNNIRFTWRGQPGLTAMADAEQLSQVLTNIVSNARDAMPSGGALEVRMRRPHEGETFSFGVVPNPRGFVQISIEDNGCGMSDDVVRHAFDPLFTTKENGGTGLGLAVAHQVAARHGGAVFLESAPGAGTTFHLFLPIAERVPAPAPTAPPPALRLRRILFIDDEHEIADGLQAIFREDGIETAIALTGAEAEVVADRFLPEVAVVDVRLPDADGFELGLRLRARLPELKIIFASGDADSKRLPADRGMAFLQKPFEIGELVRLIAVLEAGGRP